MENFMNLLEGEDEKDEYDDVDENDSEFFLCVHMLTYFNHIMLI